MASPRITVIGGGVGNARFLLGLRAHAATLPEPPDLTAVVNVGDDMWLAGLRITPDLDTVMYALAGVNDVERGWGRAGDTERVSAELAAWGVGWPWFTLGDLDVGAHVTRTSLLRDGLPLSAVVERMTARWPLGVRLLPSTDHEVETYVRTSQGDLHFQEWWTRHRAAVSAEGFDFRGAQDATPAPGVLDAIESADVVILAPSNPIVSLDPVLAIPGIRAALERASAPVVGVSPIIGGAVVRGMADQCLTAVGVETSALAVARYLGARSNGGILDAWLVDEVDAASVSALRDAGIRAEAVPLWLRDEESSAAVARAALTLVAR
ncbi:LPPG:FO 2-phospho-L-lactate transferase [Microbacteriaceae bacterium SG_E_30_P1]|uniref:LPPG:FO 2-phospho-L-lactate transferase n=1 Tax=Antiquaquibacter oligotrophicus TaxID=2880260 RepID=A0ABT6KTE3_9MICO|nr:2-phospho-L-lactate transferase [Antiquaquibacter oligotrophicus]MDH6182337.1 LPPG:FO 2-phospho-L-lactate transferase [Antiquaquibacter oligotrophicus]UDF12010.1 2-phospho-L-lactate transferase [Antiquaquibacter oligotrophicus]